LREVLALADTITVIRRGRVVWTGETTTIDSATLATLIVGERLDTADLAATAAAPLPTPVLSVAGLTVADDDGRIALHDASFHVRAREIVGVAGIEGSGQLELVEALVGLRRIERGTLEIDGRSARTTSVRERRERGLAYIPADRDETGSCLDATLTENLLAGRQRQQPFMRAGLLRWPIVRRWAADLLARFDVRGGGPRSSARSLSGGNLQRTVVARELSETPRLLIAAHPTRGVDIRGIDFIHRQLAAARDAGCAIVLVSSELDELLALADRLVILFNGHLVADLSARTANAERLGTLMTGMAT
jgi:ABC-type uncharacterized transport system ATPase subunit